MAHRRNDPGEGADVRRLLRCLRAIVAGIRAGERHQGHDGIGRVAGIGAADDRRAARKWRRSRRGDSVAGRPRGAGRREAYRSRHGSRPARVGLGVAVRAGTPKPDVGTVEAFKQVVLAARTVSASSTSGIWLVKDLFPRLGIADKIDIKITPRGTGAAGMVADGGAGVAVLPISEILTAKGVDYAGSLAPDIQFLQVFSAAIVAGSGEVDNAKRLIAFFASPRAAEAIKKSGMEPVASAR